MIVRKWAGCRSIGSPVEGVGWGCRVYRGVSLGRGSGCPGNVMKSAAGHCSQGVNIRECTWGVGCAGSLPCGMG